MCLSFQTAGQRNRFKMLWGSSQGLHRVPLAPASHLPPSILSPMSWENCDLGVQRGQRQRRNVNCSFADRSVSPSNADTELVHNFFLSSLLPPPLPPIPLFSPPAIVVAVLITWKCVTFMTRPIGRWVMKLPKSSRNTKMLQTCSSLGLLFCYFLTIKRGHWSTYTVHNRNGYLSKLKQNINKKWILKIVRGRRLSLMKKDIEKVSRASQDNPIFSWKDVVTSTAASQMKTDYCATAIKRVGPNYISSLGFH